MTEKLSTRRRLLKTTSAALLAGLAGCSGSTDSNTTATGSAGTETSTETSTATTTETSTETATVAPSDQLRGPKDGDDLPPIQRPDDGYPPEFETVPAERSIDTSAFDVLERETQDGTTVEVPLIPIEDAYYMYARGKARFVDARSETGYDVSHIYGAVLSPAPDGRRSDPTADWDKQDAVITYCHCPHHLSSMRAAELLDNGFQNVYAIDEGYQAWLDRNYPLAGSDTDRDYTVRTIEGETSVTDAGETAWAIHPSTDQVEATEIERDGSYELALKFVNVDAQSTVRVETPSYVTEAPLGVLTSTTVTSETGTAPTAGGSNVTSNTTTNTTTTFTNSTSNTSANTTETSTFSISDLF